LKSHVAAAGALDIRASIESPHRIAFLRAGSSRGTRAAMLKRYKWSDKI